MPGTLATQPQWLATAAMSPASIGEVAVEVERRTLVEGGRHEHRAGEAGPVGRRAIGPAILACAEAVVYHPCGDGSAGRHVPEGDILVVDSFAVGVVLWSLLVIGVAAAGDHRGQHGQIPIALAGAVLGQVHVGVVARAEVVELALARLDVVADTRLVGDSVAIALGGVRTALQPPALGGLIHPLGAVPHGKGVVVVAVHGHIHHHHRAVGGFALLVIATAVAIGGSLDAIAAVLVELEVLLVAVVAVGAPIAHAEVLHDFETDRVVVVIVEGAHLGIAVGIDREAAAAAAASGVVSDSPSCLDSARAIPPA